MTRALSSTERSIVGSVSQERLMADTEAIARWVRLSGTNEELAAFDHVDQSLRGMGLETTRHMARAYVSLPESAELTVEGRTIATITHSMAASTPEEGLRLPLVYAGSGTEEDYSSRDVRGKAVLVNGVALRDKVRTAEQAGVAACIFANRDQHVHEMLVSMVWGSPTPHTRDQLPRVPVVSVDAAGGQALHKALAEHSSPTAHLKTRVSTGWREIPTLTTQVDGVEEPDKFVLFSGHVDSWHHGAMDNASANATMLETLRVLLPHRASFRRGLRLAFWSGHEHGRYAGSTWYADNFWEDLHDNCVLHLYTDSPGGRGATVLTEGKTMAETRGCAAGVIRALTGEEFTGTRFGRSGDQSFMGHGIPSLFIFLSEQPSGQDGSVGDVAEVFGRPGAKGNGVGWWWHTTEDTIDKIDPAFLLRDAQIYATVTYRFLSSTLLPLDVRASAEELLQHLRGWQEKAGGRFDLSAAVARAKEVVDLAGQLQPRLDAGGSEELAADTARHLNEVVKRTEAGLIRLNYSCSDPFEHDAVLDQPPIPLLAPVDQLLLTDSESDEAYETLTLLVRRRNRILFELSQVRRALLHGLTV